MYRWAYIQLQAVSHHHRSSNLSNWRPFYVSTSQHPKLHPTTHHQTKNTNPIRKSQKKGENMSASVKQENFCEKCYNKLIFHNQVITFIQFRVAKLCKIIFKTFLFSIPVILQEVIFRKKNISFKNTFFHDSK